MAARVVHVPCGNILGTFGTGDDHGEFSIYCEKCKIWVVVSMYVVHSTVCQHHEVTSLLTERAENIEACANSVEEAVYIYPVE